MENRIAYLMSYFNLTAEQAKRFDQLEHMKMIDWPVALHNYLNQCPPIYSEDTLFTQIANFVKQESK